MKRKNCKLQVKTFPGLPSLTCGGPAEAMEVNLVCLPVFKCSFSLITDKNKDTRLWVTGIFIPFRDSSLPPREILATVSQLLYTR